MLATLIIIVFSAMFGYFIGRVSKPSNTMLLEGAALVGSAGDHVRNCGHENFALALYRLSNELRKASE